MTALSSLEKLQLREESKKNWLHSLNPEEFDDMESEVSSVVESSIVDSEESSIVESSIIDSSDSESGEEQHLGMQTSYNRAAAVTDLNKSYTDITDLPNYNEVLNFKSIKNQLQQIQELAPAPTFSNISITNSTNVRFGNVIKVKNLNINVINNNNEANDIESKQEEEKEIPTTELTKKSEPQKVYRPACYIISRYRWLAMDPLNESSCLKGPIDLVIISHTATPSSTDQPGNIGIIRDMQTLHIETEGRNDIIYNFLIGCDGNVYEGRGWCTEGDHTVGYNNRSIGITFVGTFSRKLPSERALKACRNLLIRGVVEGHLTKDYKLLAQCQCSSNDSTGIKLYEEIQNWEQFNKDKDGNMVYTRERE